MTGALQGGPIVSGRVRDSDYLGDNRTMEFSRSENDADRGSIWAFSTAMGPRGEYRYRRATIEVIPLAGYSFSALNLRLRNGLQTIPPTGPFPGLASSYDARWHGPFGGLELGLSYGRLSMRFTAEYHYYFYHADANWNLRTDFAHPVSFRHTARGNGVRIAAELRYALGRGTRLSLELSHNNRETGPGNDRTFFADGSFSDTQLNVVNNDSTAIALGLSRDF